MIIMAIRKLKCTLQHVLPHHCLSRMVAKLADCRIPWVKNSLIKSFIYYYKVDISTAAAQQLSEYASFNHFFTRALCPQARPIIRDRNVLISPADGVVSQSGAIRCGRLLQAKGHTFSLCELLGGDEGRASTYQDGEFCTIYLAPHDYHRVHMPLAGKLLQTIYVPGKLFSVNQRSVKHVPNLFCRNERLICLFETAIGEMAIIMIGAMLVAGIETVWEQWATPCPSRNILITQCHVKQIELEQGDEMGRFKFGSTVILLFRPHTTQLEAFAEGQSVNMGRVIGRVIQAGK